MYRYLAATLVVFLSWTTPLAATTYYVSASYLQYSSSVRYFMVHDTAGHVWHYEKVKISHKTTGMTLRFSPPAEMEGQLFLTSVSLSKLPSGYLLAYRSLFGLPNGFVLHAAEHGKINYGERRFCSYKFILEGCEQWAYSEYPFAGERVEGESFSNTKQYRLPKECDEPIFLRFGAHADSIDHYYYYFAATPTAEDRERQYPVRLHTRQFSYSRTPVQMLAPDTSLSFTGYFKKPIFSKHIYMPGKRSGEHVFFRIPAEEEYAEYMMEVSSPYEVLEDNSMVNYSHHFRTRRLPDTYTMTRYPYKVSYTDDLMTRISCDPAYTFVGVVLAGNIGGTIYSWVFQSPIYQQFDFRLPELPYEISKMERDVLPIDEALRQCDTLRTSIDFIATNRDVSLQDCPNILDFGSMLWLFDNNAVTAYHSHNLVRRQREK